MSRVLVCGGRDYADRARVFAALDRWHALHPITLLIHGGARGADAFAEEWAIVREVTTIEYPADWNAHGRAAGAIRNAHMLRAGEPTVVLAFPGGRGTADMVAKAEAAGVTVHRIPARRGA